MMYSILATIPLFLGLASARKCQKLTIPIQASGRNGVFNLAPPATDIDVADFILNLVRQGTNYPESILSGVSMMKDQCRQQRLD